jgi:putative drug exporter of the RND superfamily
VYAIVSAGLLLELAAPLLSLRLGAPDDGNEPQTWPQRRAYDAVTAGFGRGFNAPLLVTVTTPGGTPDAAPTADLAARLAGDPEVQHVTEPVPSPDGDLVLLVVIPRHAPQDAQVTDLVHRIRDTTAPATLTGASRAYVGGQTAFMIDAADAVAVRLPWVIAGVVLAAGLLLLAMFRAPPVAVKATVMRGCRRRGGPAAAQSVLPPV